MTSFASQDTFQDASREASQGASQGASQEAFIGQAGLELEQELFRLFRSLLGYLVRLSGWRLEGEIPRVDKGVMLMVPHTSNWDFVIGMPMLLSEGLSISWIGKHTLFETPILGRLLRSLGGIPVDRRHSHNLVHELAERIRASRQLVLGLAPEGTRSWAPHWKSGFYHIALEAGVPIYPAYLDYKRKVGGVGPALHPTGNLRSDMDRLRALYADKTACYPEHFGPVRLKEEG